jgi:hypothetical protein
MTENLCNPYNLCNGYTFGGVMSVRTVMPKMVQSGDTLIIGDHRWFIKSLSEPDYAGAVDASLVDAEGREKWSCLYDAVTIEV